jgi:hypothetical protein
MSANLEQPLILSRQSRYIQNVLVPEKTQPVSIPDDVTTRHVIKTLATTVNETLTPLSDSPFNQGNQSGMYLLFMNSPNYVFGIHYRWNFDTDSFVMSQLIIPSQQFNLDYDYVRLISRGMTFNQSTISTTNVTLSGTINAITYDGTPSELITSIYPISLDTTFSQIFTALTGAQSNNMDKVIGQSLAWGVQALAIPNQFNVPYIRTDDLTPYSTTGATVVKNTINSIDQDLSYVVQFNGIATTEAFLGQFNIDCPPGEPLNIQGQVYVNGATSIKTLQMSPLDINNNPLGTYTLCSVPAVTPGMFTVSFSRQIITTTDYTFGLLFTINLGSAPAPIPLINGEYITVNVSVPNASMNGIIRPTTLIAYDGANLNSQLVFQGLSHYEMIPNPSLFRNLTTYYGSCDEDCIKYMKNILCNRDRFQIRTVMGREEYNNLRIAWSSIWNIDDNEAAMAFDWKDLLRGIKSIALPAANLFIPGAAAITPLIDSVTDQLISNAAGNMYRAKAASGQARAASGVARRAYAMDEYVVIPRTHTPTTELNQQDKAIKDTATPKIYNKLLELDQVHEAMVDTAIKLLAPLNLSNEQRAAAPKAFEIAIHQLPPFRLKTTRPCIVRSTKSRANAMDSFPEILEHQIDEIAQLTTVNTGDVIDVGDASTDIFRFNTLPTRESLLETFIPKMAILFPTIIGDSLQHYCTYAVIDGYHPELLGDEQQCHTPSLNGHNVYGAQMESRIGFNIDCDKTLIYVHATQRHTIFTAPSYKVAGTSFLGALALSCDPKLKLLGISPSLVTGSILAIKGQPTRLISNVAYYLKKAYCNKIGVQLIGVEFRKRGMSNLSLNSIAQELLERASIQKPIKMIIYDCDIDSIEMRSRVANASTAMAMDEEQLSTNLLNTIGILQDQLVNTVDVLQDQTTEDIGRDMNLTTPVTSTPIPAVRRQPINSLTNLGKASVAAEQNVGYRKAKMPDLTKYRSDEDDTISWLKETGVLQQMELLPVTDPTGARTKQVLRNITINQIGDDTVSATSIAAQSSRAKKVIDNVFSQSGVSVPMEWVIANNFRGPNPTQVAAFKSGNQWPDTGLETTTPKKVSPEANVNYQNALQQQSVRDRAIKGLKNSIAELTNFKTVDGIPSIWMEALDQFIDINNAVPIVPEVAKVNKMITKGLASSEPLEFLTQQFLSLTTLPTTQTIRRPEPETITISQPARTKEQLLKKPPPPPQAAIRTLQSRLKRFANMPLNF